MINDSIIQCPNCKARYAVSDAEKSHKRKIRCGSCHHVWINDDTLKISPKISDNSRDENNKSISSRESLWHKVASEINNINRSNDENNLVEKYSHNTTNTFQDGPKKITGNKNDIQANRHVHVPGTSNLNHFKANIIETRRESKMRRMHYVKKTRRKVADYIRTTQMLLVGHWIISILLLFLTIPLITLLFVDYIPSNIRHYLHHGQDYIQRLGVYDTDGIVIDDVRINPIYRVNNPSLDISLNIYNKVDKDLLFPRMVIAIYNKDHKLLKSIRISKNEKIIFNHSKEQFNYRLTNMPYDSYILDIKIGDRLIFLNNWIEIIESITKSHKFSL